MTNEVQKTVQNLTVELKHRCLTIAVAESCTGGMISGFLTQLPGSSQWFERGFVTYTNLAKQEMLGVAESLIAQKGAVSEEVAQAMAIGALQHSSADLALSVTGIAGPDGGSLLKPVGTVCFSWVIRNKTPHSERIVLAGPTREKIRMQACQYALQGMLSILHTFG